MAEDIEFGAATFSADLPDLDPAPKVSTKSSNGKRPPGRPSTVSKLAEVQSEIEGLLKLALLPVLFKDQHIIVDGQGEVVGEPFSCAEVYLTFDKTRKPVLTPEGKALAEAAAGIVFESTFLMKALNAGDSFGKYLKLFMALQPGLMAVFNNHVRVGRGKNGESEMGGIGA